MRDSDITLTLIYTYCHTRTNSLHLTLTGSDPDKPAHICSLNTQICAEIEIQQSDAWPSVRIHTTELDALNYVCVAPGPSVHRRFVHADGTQKNAQKSQNRKRAHTGL